jgi:phosphoribosylformylglycinamidine synthase
MASKGGVGIRLDMNKVPCREEGMTPYEMMLSESQERMLMVLKPGREAEAEAVFRKWELDFAVIGEVTDTERMELVWNGEKVADIPLGPLADEAPCYERPYAIPKPPEPLTDIPESTDIAADLLKLMASPNLASRRWVWEQYDQQVGADTVQRPGGDAAVVRVHGSKKALAITTDCTPRYCYADPVEGGKQAVAEAYRNLCAVGAKPLAITNCLNFGNPQRPEIMGQFVGCIDGMTEACRALDFPVVSGNVSLYNETKNEDGSSVAILPTPAIGGVGLLDDWEKTATIGLQDEISVNQRTQSEEAARIVLLGTPRGHVGQSLWLRELHNRAEGPPPPVDLQAEHRVGEFVRNCIADGLVLACHDVSDGGILVALAEMALANDVGAFIFNGPWEQFGAAAAFAEDQGLYVVSTLEDADEFIARARAGGVDARLIGRAGNSELHPRCIIIDFAAPDYDDGGNDVLIPLSDLRAAHEGFFPKLMGGELPPEF